MLNTGAVKPLYPASGKPRRRPSQFHLGTLLILIAIVCCLIAGPIERAHNQRTALDAVHAVRGEAFFDWQEPMGTEGNDNFPLQWPIRNGSPPVDPEFPAIKIQNVGVTNDGIANLNITTRTRGFDATSDSGPPGPRWLRRIIGNEYFQSVRVIEAGRYTKGDVDSPPVVTDETLQFVSRLTSLECLGIAHAKKVDDGGFAALERLTRLQALYADGIPITDRGMQHVARLTNLEVISISSPRVTDEGVKLLRGLKHLRFIYLGHTKITDHGLGFLQELDKLEYVCVPDTAISQEAAERFQKPATDTFLGREVSFAELGADGSKTWADSWFHRGD